MAHRARDCPSRLGRFKTLISESLGKDHRVTHTGKVGMRALHGCSATLFLSIPQFPGYAVHVADDVIAATAEVFLNGRIVLPGMKSPDGTFRRCRWRPDDSIVRLWANPQRCLCSWSHNNVVADNDGLQGSAAR